MEAIRELDLKSRRSKGAGTLSTAGWNGVEAGFSSKETTEPSNTQTTKKSKKLARIQSTAREKNRLAFHSRLQSVRFRKWLRESASQKAILYLVTARRPK